MHKKATIEIIIVAVGNLLQQQYNFHVLVSRSGLEGCSSGVLCGEVFTCPPSRAASALNPWSSLTNATRTANAKKHS